MTDTINIINKKTDNNNITHDFKTAIQIMDG